MNDYEGHARLMADEGVWTPEFAEGWVEDAMRDDRRDSRAEMELEEREKEGAWARRR